MGEVDTSATEAHCLRNIAPKGANGHSDEEAWKVTRRPAPRRYNPGGRDHPEAKRSIAAKPMEEGRYSLRAVPSVAIVGEHSVPAARPCTATAVAGDTARTVAARATQRTAAAAEK